MSLKMLKCRGFSLLETLIAITVITVGLVGVMGLIVHNISLAKVSPERVIAVNLAQEGIEVVRNIRDSNWLAGNDWYNGICDPGAGGKWRGTVNYASTTMNYLSNAQGWDLDDCGENCRLKINNGFYSHNVGSATSFYRLIRTDKMSLDSLSVESKVRWTDRSGATHTITLEDHLYDWK